MDGIEREVEKGGSHIKGGRVGILEIRVYSIRWWNICLLGFLWCT